MNSLVNFSFKTQRNIVFFLFLFIANAALAQTATIKTDQPDYAPGSTVIITGTGWQPGETVTLQVVHHLENGDNDMSTAHQPFTTIADANGNVSSTWYVPFDEDELGATLLLTADGGSSGLHAEIIFTDSNLQSVTVTPTSPTSVTYGTGATVTYTVAVAVNGNNSALNNVQLSVSGVPAGATVSWSPGNTINFPNGSNSSPQNVTLTISVQSAKVQAATAFTVTATAGAASKTGNGSLTITPLAITGNITADSRVYNSTTAATIATRTLTGVVNGDNVTYSGGTATFSNKNMGTGKTVTATGLTLSGTDLGNYTVNSTAVTTADITAKGLVGAITAANKLQYDGTTTTTISTRTLSGVIGTDVVTYTGGTANFDTKDAGNGKTVTATGLSLTGADASNYTVNTTAVTTANIGKRTLTITATGVDKVYDGTVSATVTLNDDRIAGDVFTDVYTATFANRNVGTAKAVSVSGISISGADAANYTSNATAATTASITAKALAISATGVNKIYDGNANASVTLGDNRVAGDVFTDTYTSALFNNKNAGTGKPVSVSGINISGTDAANYTSNATASTTADITAKALTISATGVNKIYDGNANASVTLNDDRVAGDVFTDTYTSALFNNKNVGTGKPVSVSGVSISGADAANYTSNATASTTADITAKALTISATGVNKIYDGNASASVTLNDDRVAGDVFTDTYTSALFNNKNVGTGKPVSVSGVSISGADAANYTSNATASTTADITAKALTISATGINKVYDGNANASVTLGDNRVAGDVFTDAYTGALFNNKNVGTGKNVSVSGVSISGTDAGNYSFNTTAVTTANITSKALIITANDASRQYSDPDPAFSVTYASFMPGDGPADLGGTLLFTTNAVSASGPGSYIITPGGLTSSNYAITFKPGALAITKEDAKVTYTGLTLAATSSTTATTATVTLSATVQDITAAPDDAAYDPYLGDIRNATVTFNVDGIDKATVPVGLVNAADTKTGTAVYNWTGATLGEHNISIKVNGYYLSTGSGDNLVVVEVYQPAGDFITGGGYLKLTNSNGLKAGDAGTNNNFGFNIKYNKGGTNLQGTINTIVRRMEGGILHVYQVKGNSMTSLTVDPTTGTASHPYPTAVFNGKANITDITNPLSPLTVDGNATLQVSMTDAGEPGSNDKIGIIVYNKNGGVWCSSNWDGTKTVQQTLAGGNLLIHGSNSAGSTTSVRVMDTASIQTIAPVPLSDKFNVKVSGNPTQTYFTIQVQSSTDHTVEIKIFDLTGRQVQQAKGAVGESFRLGSPLTQGIYIVEVRQGINHSTIKVVKN